MHGQKQDARKYFQGTLNNEVFQRIVGVTFPSSAIAASRAKTAKYDVEPKTK